MINKESFDVVSAGFCLDGEDTKFHFKDLPFIATKGEQEDLIYEVPIRYIDFEGAGEI